MQVAAVAAHPQRQVVELSRQKRESLVRLHALDEQLDHRSQGQWLR